MSIETIIAIVVFAIGYVTIAMPLIGKAAGSNMGYICDLKVGAAIHIGIIFLCLIAAAVSAFVWSAFYLIEAFIF